MGCEKRVAIVVADGTLAATAQVATAGSRDACSLGNGIEHVVGLQFDNVHFTRDNPNVSDSETPVDYDLGVFVDRATEELVLTAFGERHHAEAV
jgi:hypothetical protein